MTGSSGIRCIWFPTTFEKAKIGLTGCETKRPLRRAANPSGCYQRRPCRRNLANAARLGGVPLLAQLFVELLPIPEHAPDERPEPIMLLRIRQPLAAENDQAIELPAPGLQQDVEALDILDPARRARRAGDTGSRCR